MLQLASLYHAMPSKLPNPKAREILNELKWRKDRDLNEAEIWYLHRGDKEGYRIIKGSEIKELEKSFLSTATASIPYYKIFKIVYEGKIIFERR